MTREAMTSHISGTLVLEKHTKEKSLKLPVEKLLETSPEKMIKDTNERLAACAYLINSD